MNESNVHVVVGETGEYSDANWWFVRAFSTKGEAESFAQKINEWCAANGVAWHSAGVRYEACNKKCPLDPSFGCDHLTGTKYYATEIPLELAGKETGEI